MNRDTKNGVLLAIAAYTMWGLAPVYFKLLQDISSVEILIHRIVWSVVMLAVLLTIQRNWSMVRQVLKSPRYIGLLLLSSCFLAFNWWVFIWAINSNRMLEASLGYYINPIINVAFGMIFLAERLTKLQYLAVALAIAGIIIEMITYGSFPYVSFALATSFSIYGLIRKMINVDAVSGIFLESALLALPAIAVWSVMEPTSTSAMFNNSHDLNLLLIAAGLVTTAPLLAFVGAAKRLNYSSLGFFQYIGPSIMFLFAVYVYEEQLNAAKWQTFGFIWTALLVYSYASYQKIKHTQRKKD